ncbi:hypothetical protein P7245_22405 [Vibrio parahaemolyticus]|nr:hypothetical protein [Vibrio parahaemolyticus]
MAATILYSDDELLEVNNDVSASNRIAYNAYTANLLAGAARNHSNGELREESIKTINYDLVQNSPEDFDAMAQIIKPLTTEFHQANVMPRESSYNRVVIGDELKTSALKNISVANARAKLINNLNKLWDFYAYTGGGVNTGVSDNSYVVSLTALPMTTVHEVNAAITAGIETMKSYLGIGDSDMTNVSVGYTNGISPVLSTIFESGDIARKLITDAHPSVKFGQVPRALSKGDDYIEISYRPAVEIDHGALPGFYSEEKGKHGLSSELLAVFESARVNLDETGAIVRVPASSVPPASKSLKGRTANK